MKYTKSISSRSLKEWSDYLGITWEIKIRLGLKYQIIVYGVYYWNKRKNNFSRLSLRNRPMCDAPGLLARFSRTAVMFCSKLVLLTIKLSYFVLSRNSRCLLSPVSDRPACHNSVISWQLKCHSYRNTLYK